MCRKLLIIVSAVVLLSLVGAVRASIDSQFIPADKITPSASSEIGSGGRTPERTIDGSGMDPSGYRHENYCTSGEYWLSAYGGGGSAYPHPGTEPGTAWLKYEFDQVYTLRRIWVWNYGDLTGGHGARAIKKVYIEYTSDGKNYQKLMDGDNDYWILPNFEDPEKNVYYERTSDIDCGGIDANAVVITTAIDDPTWGELYHAFSEIRFLPMLSIATVPSPQDQSEGQDVEVDLNWVPGEGAVSHDVYFGGDSVDVDNATSTDHPDVVYQNVDVNSFDLPLLELGSTYYWRVDEVDGGGAIHRGPVWMFTIADSHIVDDMESYDHSNPIYDTWHDGYENNNGSLVGYKDEAHYMEQDIVHGGSQAMYYSYDNQTAAYGYYSEAEAAVTDLEIGHDWTKGGSLAIDIWFHGSEDNVPDQMYVGIADNTNSAFLDYPGDANDLQLAEWQVWRIALSDFTGVNPQNVQMVYLGFGDRENPEPGGTGVVYFDDIAVFPRRCLLVEQEIEFDLNEDCIVDFQDLSIFMAGWLETGLFPKP